VTRAFLAALLCLVGSPARAAGDDPNAIARAVGEKFAAACAAGDVPAVLALYRDDARVVFPGEGQTAVTRAELEKLVAGMCVKGGPKLVLVGYRAVWADSAHTVVAALGDWRMDATSPEEVRRRPRVRRRRAPARPLARDRGGRRPLAPRREPHRREPHGQGE
jgi:hypothetical protein